MVETTDAADAGNPQVRLCEIVRASGSCGFNLTKSKWDPYPWVSTVECGSPADIAGVRPGDCLLEVNGEDILGLRVREVASRVKARDDSVTVMLWNSGSDPTCTPEALCCGPMPTNLQRLSTCMSNILAALECPVCLDTIPPPAHQCANGHLICINCRVRTERCPVCRMKFFRGRSLLADQVFNSLILAFDLADKEESKRAHMLRQRICSRHKSKGPEIKINFPASSPKNKLLARLLGSRKSSSAENLSVPSNHSPTNLSVPSEEDLYSGLRAKSLSSNEIFAPEVQTPTRTPSVLSNRPGSGLLDIVTLSKRPASYHGSSENLSSRILSDFGSDVSKSFPCPFECRCEPVRNGDVVRHLETHHEEPILHFFRPRIRIRVPPKSSTSLVTAHGTLFVVKIADGNVTVWSANDDGGFVAEISAKPAGADRCRVLPLSSFNWTDTVAENCGLQLENDDSKVELHILKSD